MTAAALLAPQIAATGADDSLVVAIVLLRDGRVRRWRHASTAGDWRVDDWTRHALDGGRLYADLTEDDLAALSESD